MDPVASSTELNELRRLMAATPENGGSFKALLELPTPQAMELLHSSENGQSPVTLAGNIHVGDVQSSQVLNSGSFVFPTSSALIERAAKYSVFAANSSSETSSMSASSKQKVKAQPAESEAKHNSAQPLVAEQIVNFNGPRAGKRKEREKKGKGSSKKSKNDSSVDAQMLPYVHVRARRGQATDSHSLAERARREKINARMKLLQEIVPGCNKISGTALVLDEIINHVQSLQRQVEFLSMRLAAVNPGVDFNFDGILAAESGSFIDSNFSGLVMHPLWPEFQTSGNRQQYQHQSHLGSLNQPLWGREEVNHSFVAPENSLLSYDASVTSGSLPANQVKMEL